MFSRSPFIKEDTKDFSFVKASYELTNKLVNDTKDYRTDFIKIPPSLINNNLFIQVSSESRTKALNYFPTDMQIYLMESNGKVKVKDFERNPLSKIYVKCFKKGNNGLVGFYKDGYTDITGTFDYASLNLDSLDQGIEVFALLVNGEESGHGAIIIEVKPPKFVGRNSIEAKELISKKWRDVQELNCNKMVNCKFSLF